MSSRFTASGVVHATTGVFCVFDPIALRPLFAPGEFKYEKYARDDAMLDWIRGHEDQAARDCLVLRWDSGSCGFHGGRLLVRNFHTSGTGLRSYYGHFQVASGRIRVSEAADAGARIRAREMRGVGFEVELPVGIYRLRLVELAAVSEEDEEDAIVQGESIQSLIELASRSLEEEEREDDDPPIYLLEFERTQHAVPPAAGPTGMVWGPSWK